MGERSLADSLWSLSCQQVRTFECFIFSAENGSLGQSLVFMGESSLPDHLLSNCKLNLTYNFYFPLRTGGGEVSH